MHTFRMSHLLHGSWSNHNRHRYIESQHSGTQIHLCYINQYMGTEPDTYNINQNICNNVNSPDASNERGVIMFKSLAQDRVTKIEN